MKPEEKVLWDKLHDICKKYNIDSQTLDNRLETGMKKYWSESELYQNWELANKILDAILEKK